MDAYGSFLPLLVGAVARTDGPVLELGCGEYSTLVLHEMCRASGRWLLSAESDAGWHARFADLAGPRHCVDLVTDWEAWWTPLLAPLADPWDVAFVDHAPGERRAGDIARLRAIAKYIIVHDTEAPSYGYESVLRSFAHRYDYTRLCPHTTIVSDVASVEWART